ncbi:hypothetical protein BYT27DRAFT_7190260 [Phlegmacium glaucopus]|nr:hypothetical protein BYT27DRAFT_7190260 [Phlegmacium glaucopus]
MSQLQSILNPESSRRQQLSVTTLPEDQRSSSADQRSSSADDEISPASSDEVDELDEESEEDDEYDPQNLRPDGPGASEGDEHDFATRKDGKGPQKHLDPYQHRQSTAPRRKLEKHDRKIDLGLHDHKAHADCPDTLACLPDTNGRPQHTLPVILRCAILGSSRKRLTIREIYAAMESKYPFYKSAGQTWKQSVRHHLSLNRLFERQPRPVTDPGFGSYWTVNLDAPPGTKRPRKRGRPNRDTGEGSSRKTAARAQIQPQNQLNVQSQHNLPPQPTQFQFQPQTHPTPPLPPPQQIQIQPMNGLQSPVSSVHSPARPHQQAVPPQPPHQPPPTRQQTLQHHQQHQQPQHSHSRHQPQQLSPVQDPPTSHQSQHYQNLPPQSQPHMQQTRHMRQPQPLHQHPPHQRQPPHHRQSSHQSQSSHQEQSSHQSQSSHHNQHQSQNHPQYKQHHHSHQQSQPRQPEPQHRYQPPPPLQPRVPSTPSTPLSGRESNFPPSSSSETEDGGKITHEKENGPTVSDDEHESEEEMLQSPHSRQSSGQGQTAFVPTRPSASFQLPPFSALEQTREDALKQMREEIATLRRTSAEAVSTSIRLSEQLANANLEVSRSREAVRDLEDMLQSEATKRSEAERLKEIEIERRRAAEQALNGIAVRSPTRPRPSGT